MTSPLAVQLPIEELIRVVVEGKVFKIMSQKQVRQVTVDYFPARQALVFPREDGDDPIEAYPLNPIPLTFTLEDAMYGGSLYVALTCGHRVLVKPFLWSSYKELADVRLS